MAKKTAKKAVKKTVKKAAKKPAKKIVQATRSPLDRARKICLSLPEAHEVEAWGAPTFRVKNKLFAMYASPGSHHTNGRPALWLKSAPVNQDLLCHADGDRFFFPPYVGSSGWVGVYIDKKPDWKMLEDIIRDAYCLTAPKKLLISSGF
jgi:predicted DNA-binding protein (MmcQ/YjbR family)